MLGTLFITVVGGGSGLALGMASILVTDIFARKNPRVKADSRTSLLVTRGDHPGHPGPGRRGGHPGPRGHDQRLRLPLHGPAGGGGLPPPVRGPCWLKGKIPRPFTLTAILAGPVAVLAGNFLNLPFDPLFLGMAVCLVIMAAGLAAGRNKHDTLSTQ